MDTRLDALKTVSTDIVHKTGEIIKKNTADAVTKLKDDKIVKQETVEEIVITAKKGKKV